MRSRPRSRAYRRRPLYKKRTARKRYNRRLGGGIRGTGRSRLQSRASKRYPTNRRRGGSRVRVGKQLNATKWSQPSVRVNRRSRVRKPSRKFKRDFTQLVHNPQKINIEYRDTAQWAAASCHWYQGALGNHSEWDAMFLQAKANAFSGVTLPNQNPLTTPQADLGVICHTMSLKTTMLNPGNGSIRVSVYECTPKSYITDEPLDLLSVINTELQAVNSISVSTGTGPISSVDYNYTPFMSKSLTNNFKVKFVKNMNIAPGARAQVSIHHRGTYKRSMIEGREITPQTSLPKLCKFLIMKVWGDWGIKNVAPPMLRTAEGMIGFMEHRTYSFSYLPDLRPAVYNSYYLDDKTGSTKLTQNPEVIFVDYNAPGFVAYP